MFLALACLLSLTGIVSLDMSLDNSTSTNTCNVDPRIVAEIASYEPIAKLILHTLRNKDKGKTYNDLAFFVDTFGPRLTGSESLENSIDFMLAKMRANGFENVRGEPVRVTHWVRGKESATLISPRKAKLFMLGLGNSVETPPGGITAPAIVVNTFDDLKAKAPLIPGKIVVYNQDFKTYPQSVEYRYKGASEAARYGAVAALVRSATDFSLRTPHTGAQTYAEDVNWIPVACISVEDAIMLDRMQARGNDLIIYMEMEATSLPMVYSRNPMGEIVGREKPEEVVILSGHIDSWDIGQGAMDDGGGVFISYEAVSLIKSLNLRPRRTLRAAFWTGEEFGFIGSQGYAKTHSNQLSKLQAVMSSDFGTFTPRGLYFWGRPEAGCILQEILQLLKSINASGLYYASQLLPKPLSDIGVFVKQGVPGIEINTANERYLHYHHSEADTMSLEDPEALDLCTAVWATVAYVLADMNTWLPRDKMEPNL